MKPRTSAMVASVLLLITACEQPGESRSGQTARWDSTPSRTLVGREDAATYGSWERLVVLGLTEGPSEYLFDRAVPGFVTPDGTLYVSNVGSAEVRAYSDEGRFLFAFGRRGEGPGEFIDLRWVRPFGLDSLVALDAARARLAVFDRAGRFSRQIQIDLEDGHQDFREMFVTDEGGFVLAVTSGLDPRRVGLARDSIELWTVDGTGTTTARTLRIPDLWWQSSRGPSGFGLAAAPDGPFAAFDRWGGMVAVASNDAPAIQLWSPSGDLLGVFDDPGHPKRAGLRVPASIDEANQQGRFYDQLKTSSDGFLWIGQSIGAQDADRVWLVINREGSVVEWTHLPAAARIWQADHDSLVIWATDDHGVERVEIWRRATDGDS